MLDGLPEEIKNKINKTKQTRGAQPADRVAYQNRVNRNGVAIVPYGFRHQLHPDGFENGYRILVRPHEFFAARGRRRDDFDKAVRIGRNGFIYYDNRSDWTTLPPLKNWRVAESRDGSGHYIARVPGTTATEGGEPIVLGAPQGIRFFEYAPSGELRKTAAQLAWLAWRTIGIDAIAPVGPPESLADFLGADDLADVARFEEIGAVRKFDDDVVCTCPLCQKPVRAHELMSRVAQAAGREVVDLTITEANLFHVKDLRPGEYNHRAYALAWGHHHCNAVARDDGVPKTLDWMEEVLRRHGRLA